MAAAFPVLEGGDQKYCPSGCAGSDPNGPLMLHEWLHQVVSFYDPVQGWPTNDVHGGREHGYCESSTRCSQVYEPYFIDLMQGRVREGDRLTGMLPGDWARDGTPALPRRQPAPAWDYDLPSEGGLIVNVPMDYDGKAHIVISSAGAVVAETRQPAGPWAFSPSTTGTYDVCVDLPATDRYRARLGWCAENVSVGVRTERPSAESKPRCRVPRLIGRTLTRARRLAKQRGCALGSTRRRPLSRREARRGMRAGRIVRQSVAPGERRSAGARIHITVGKRPR